MRRYMHSWDDTLTTLGFKRRTNKTTSRKTHAGKSLRVESLEDRRMLATLTVNTTADIVADDGVLSLREAMLAISDSYDIRDNIPSEQVDLSTPYGSNDTILFDASLNGSSINLGSEISGSYEQLTIDASNLTNGLTIRGNSGSTALGDGSRIFSFNRGGIGNVPSNIEFAGLTLTGGDASGDGGAIAFDYQLYTGSTLSNTDSIVFRNSTITGNYSGGNGGGVAVTGINGTSTYIDLKFIDSTVSDNDANSDGGGVYAYSWTSVDVFRSTFDNNKALGQGGSAGDGGAIYQNGRGQGRDISIVESTLSNNEAARYGGGVYYCVKHSASTSSNFVFVRATNSTISGNQAGFFGGGIYTGAIGNPDSADIQTFLTNVTVFNNIAPGSGAGLYLLTGENGGDVFAANSIIAGNGTSSHALRNLFVGNNTEIASLKNNLIGDAANSDTANNGSSSVGNSFNVTTTALALSSLGFNGGPTETHEPLAGSIAIDYGINSLSVDPLNGAALVTDQRGGGFARILGGIVDAGAHESPGTIGSGDGPTVIDVVALASDSVHSDPDATPTSQPDDPDNPFAPGYSFAGTSDDQLLAVPIGGIDSIKIVFDQPVGVDLDPDAEVLQLLPLDGPGDLDAPRVSVVRYVSPTEVIWEFEERIDPNRYQLVLDEAVLNQAGVLLDGNGSINPDDVSFPSGDGAAGGDFIFNFAVTPDFNRDGNVNLFDFEFLRVNFNLAVTSFGEGDFTGDGLIDFADFRAWKDSYRVPVSAGTAALAADVVVSTLVDEMDGDYSYGDLSLREALFMAGQVDGADTIAYDHNLFTSGSQWDFSSGFVIDSDVTIIGPGADLLTIGNAWTDRIFTVNSGVTAQISGMTITEGYASQGGLIHNTGNLTLTGMELTQGSASNGGAVWSSGNLTIRDTLVEYNGVHNGNGGAIFNQAGNFNAYNSTFSSNYHSGNGFGSAIFIDGGSGHLVNATVTGNSAFDSDYAAAIDAISFVEVDNSIVAGNTNSNTTSTPDLNFATSASSNNIIGIVDGLTFNSTNQTGSFASPLDAKIGSLQDNGGPTRTHALQADSTAINRGDTSIASSAGLIHDQRGTGFDRVLGGSVDIGAYEATLNVTSATDVNNGNFSLGDLSLREAIALAANTPGSDVITFSDSLPSQVSVNDVSLDSDLAIIGPGDGSLKLRGDFSNRIFSVQPGVSVDLRDIILADGDATNGALIYNEGDLTVANTTLEAGDASQNGGAIYSTGDLTINEGSLLGNSANGSGGAIYQQGGSLAITTTTIDGNSASFAGGGVVTTNVDTVAIASSTISRNSAAYVGGVWANNSNLDVVNSTLSTNTASNGFGGGAYLSGSTRTATFTNATIANNSAGSGSGGGLYVFGSGVDVTLNNTIVAGNTGAAGADDVYGGFNSASAFNLIGAIDGSTGLTGSSNLTGTRAAVLDAGLTALGNYGGSTETHGLLATSVAVDAGDDALAAAFGLLEDQRGEDRFEDGDGVGGSSVDMGAFELAFS